MTSADTAPPVRSPSRPERRELVRTPEAEPVVAGFTVLPDECRVSCFGLRWKSDLVSAAGFGRVKLLTLGRVTPTLCIHGQTSEQRTARVGSILQKRSASIRLISGPADRCVLSSEENRAAFRRNEDRRFGKRLSVTVMDIERWLSLFGLEQYARTFA